MGKKLKTGKTRKDKFYRLAKETGFRSRAAFKLIQLNRKFGFFQNSLVCVDLCAAPGGWMQVAKQNMPVTATIIGIDLYPIKPISNCVSFVEDITTDKCKVALSKKLNSIKADIFLHDGAPNVGKNWLFDAYQQVSLTLMALKLATSFLNCNGWFISKVFRSKDYNALQWVLKQLFKKVYTTKPSASRKESAEIFVVCEGYLAPIRIDPRLLDPKYVFQDLEINIRTKLSLKDMLKKRRRAEGYTIQEVEMRNDLLVSTFIQNDDALLGLEGIRTIVIDREDVKNHLKTTSEILECCKDINVLGRKELKGLVLWHKHLRTDLVNYNSKTDQEHDSPSKDLSANSHTNNAIIVDKKDYSKRKKKNVLKQKTKLLEKLNSKMVISGDDGPRDQGEIDIFDIQDIKGFKFEKYQDIPPEGRTDSLDVDEAITSKYLQFNKDTNRLLEELSDDSNHSSHTSSHLSEDLRISNGIHTTHACIGNFSRCKKSDFGQETSFYQTESARRQQKGHLWYGKSHLAKFNDEDDEERDIEQLINNYKRRGFNVLATQEGPLKTRGINFTKPERNANICTEKSILKRKNEASKSFKKVSKFSSGFSLRSLGTKIMDGHKSRTQLLNSTWNRHVFNDPDVPEWFTDYKEKINQRQLSPLNKSLDDNLPGLNVRPIKKIMEAKLRKKIRLAKKLAKTKKKAEKILEYSDSTAQDKMRQIKKLYRNAGSNATDITYVVAKKHLSGKRIRRPRDVKGRYKVVDPRQKKDKRHALSNKKKRKHVVKK